MGKIQSRWLRAVSATFALLLTLVAGFGYGREQEDEKEHAYIHWPPDGSRVSAGSLSAAGIRVEFSGIRDDSVFHYWTTLSVAIGNTTILSEHPYRIECQGTTRHGGAGILQEKFGNGGDRHANTEGSVRWLIPFSEVFQLQPGAWDDTVSSVPMDIFPVGDQDWSLTVVVRLFRVREGHVEQALLAAEASSKLRFLVKSAVTRRGIGAFALIRGNEDAADMEGQVRSERIQVALMETPGQFFTAAFLAEVGYTAVIRGLHLFSDYSVTLKLNGSLIMSEHLQPLRRRRDHGKGRYRPKRRCLIQEFKDIDLTTGEEVKLHSHLPLLPLGRHSARLEVRVGEGMRPVATSNVELVVVGDHVEDALGFVEPTNVEWVHDQAWCDASESNQQTCTPRGYRARGQGVPETMRDPAEVCETLFRAGVRRIHVYGDSFARHLYVALSIISSGDYTYGGLQWVQHDPQSNEWVGRECCGEAQFSEKVCRTKISLQQHVCQGRITLVRAQPAQSIPASFSREDLVLLSIGRHESELARTDATAPEPWLVPHWTPAHGPWEAEVACSLANRRAIEVWVQNFCTGRSTDVPRRGGDLPLVIFVNSHVMARSNLANICKHLEENPREKFDDRHVTPRVSLDGECKKTLDQKWTPKCLQKSHKMAKWHTRYEEGLSRDCSCNEQSADVQAMARRISMIWEAMLQSHCGQDVHVVDVIPVTRSLVNNLVEDAIDMTYDGYHWGSRVNILQAQMILHKIWQSFRVEGSGPMLETLLELDH